MMTKNFQEKLLSGKKLSEADLEGYLKIYHDQVPGMTIDKISCYLTHAGCTSYELLAREMDALPSPPQTIVDLACGNGPLIQFCLEKISKKGKIIGIDMSDGELEEARNTFRSKNVTFLCERAQSLSLADHSIDVVLCHLALMLMKPIEPVIREIGRILKPGGLFAGIILIPPKEETLFYQFSVILNQFLKVEFADSLQKGFGEMRVKTKEGLVSLFSNEEWDSPSIKMKEGEFLMSDTIENLWDHLKGFYLPRLLSNENQKKLGDAVHALFAKNVDSGGIVPLRLPFRLFSAKRSYRNRLENNRVTDRKAKTHYTLSIISTV